MVSTRTPSALLGILANHGPADGMLEPTSCCLYKSTRNIVRYAQSEGYLQVVGTRSCCSSGGRLSRQA